MSTRARQAASSSVAARPVNAAPEEPDLWTLAIQRQLGDEEKSDRVATREANIVFMGAKMSGKTSLLQSYVSKDKADDQPPATTSLDYRFIKTSSGLAVESDLTHIWELGGGRVFTDLLNIAITPQSLPHTLAIVVIDLSKPWRLVDDLAFWLTTLRQHANKIKAQNPQAYARSLDIAQQRFGIEHKELSQIDLMPMQVTVVASKFDLIKDKEIELLKIIARTLRAVCHANGVSLMYQTKRIKNLVAAFGTRLSRHVLDKEQSKTPQFEHSKPIIAPAGVDSFAQMGDVPGGASNPVAGFTALFRQHFPKPNKTDVDDEEDEAALAELQLAPEPQIDSVLAQKEEELKRRHRAAELDRKLREPARAV